MAPSGIDPATFRFVAQYLNHCATFLRGTGVISRIQSGRGVMVTTHLYLRRG
jgi:hypothetical protein